MSRNVYLAGAIEKAPKGYAEQWRNDITPILEAMGLNVINPIKADKKRPDLTANLPELKFTNLEEYRRIVKNFIIQTDMDFVRSCVGGFILLLWDKYTTLGSGTISELNESGTLGIPTIVVSKIPLSNIPGWALSANYPYPVYDCSGIEDVTMDDFKDAIDYIEKFLQKVA